MTTLGHSFVLQGDARSGGTSAGPGAGYKCWPPYAMLGSTMDTFSASA